MRISNILQIFKLQHKIKLIEVCSFLIIHVTHAFNVSCDTILLHFDLSYQFDPLIAHYGDCRCEEHFGYAQEKLRDETILKKMRLVRLDTG